MFNVYLGADTFLLLHDGNNIKEGNIKDINFSEKWQHTKCHKYHGYGDVVIVMGDFNAKVTYKDIESLMPGLLNLNFFSPTRGKRLLDLVLTNKPNLYQKPTLIRETDVNN